MKPRLPKFLIVLGSAYFGAVLISSAVYYFCAFNGSTGALGALECLFLGGFPTAVLSWPSRLFIGHLFITYPLEIEAERLLANHNFAIIGLPLSYLCNGVIIYVAGKLIGLLIRPSRPKPQRLF